MTTTNGRGEEQDRTTETTTQQVMRCHDNEALEGVCSEELAAASEAERDGAVPAYRDADGVWQYVAPSEVDLYERHLGCAVVTVYVEAE